MSPRADVLVSSSLPSAEALESELASLSASIEAATHRQLTLIRQIEQTGSWAHQGATSYVFWLGWRIGLAPVVAREKIRVARALGQLPAIDEAFSRGKLSYSKVRALTRVADASNEAPLLNMALRTTASHLETICRGVRRVARDEQGEVVDTPPERWVRERAGDDGMVRIEAQLSPDEAVLVWKAIELARGMGGKGAVIERADALVRVADAYVKGEREGQSGAERTQLVVHLQQEMIAAESVGTPMTAQLDDGTRIEAEAFRRIACDAMLLPVVVDGTGLPIDVGRRHRVVTPALRRALEVRDRGCRFPGCEHRAWIDAHHVRHWAHGGETKLANLVSLCSAHHRLVHEGGFTVTIESGDAPVFRRPDGVIVQSTPSPAAPTAWARSRLSVSAEARVDDTTLLPLWDGRTPDYDCCVAAGRSRLGSATRDARCAVRPDLRGPTAGELPAP